MPRTKAAQREGHLVEVAQLLRQGYGTRAIAAKTDRSPGQITYDKRAVIKRWQEEANEYVGQHQTLALQQVEFVLNEAAQAWQSSKGTHKTETKRVRSAGGGQATQEAEVKEQDQYGDPRYLQAAMDAIKAKVDMLGLAAPQEVEVEHTGVVGSVGLQETLGLLASLASERDPNALPPSGANGSVLSD